MKGKPGASLDESRGEVSLLCDGLPFLALCRSQAVALRDAITAALDGDPDKTPALGTPAVRKKRDPLVTEWLRFRGRISHASDCPAAESDVAGSSVTADERCDCHARGLILRLMALEVS